MADKENEDESVKVEKKSNTLMIVIIIVLILIIIIGAVLTIVLMGGDDAQTQQQQMQAPQAQVKSSSSSSLRRAALDDDIDTRPLSTIGLLYPLDTFTVNLKSDSGRRYLKVTMSLELDGEALSVELDSKSPVVRDIIIRILTSKTLEEVTSQKGKQKVSNQIKDTLNSMISDGQIRGIYFTEFVIQ